MAYNYADTFEQLAVPQAAVQPQEPTQAPQATQATAPAPAQAPQSAGGAYSINLRSYEGNPTSQGVYSKLFNPVGQGVEKSTAKLHQGARDFLQRAGGPRTFEGLGGRATLDRAVAGTTDIAEREKQLQEAQGLAFAQYKGPRGLDQDVVDLLGGSIGGLKTRAGSLRTGLGLQDLIRGQTPGLSAGELRFEAQNVLGDPRYRQEAEALERSIYGLEGDFQGAQGQASAIANERAMQEDEISRLAQEYLLSRRANEAEQIWANRIAEEEAANAAAQTSYDKFRETGSVADLQAIGPGILSEDPAALDSDTRKLYEEGTAKRNEILAKYQDLQDAGVPLMEVQSTKKGRETLGFPQEWYDANKDKFTDSQMEDMKKRSRQLYKDLVEAGFSSRAENYQTPEVSFKTEGEGKYGNILPLAFGNDYQMQDLQSYVGPLELVSPTRENISTDEQRGVYNNINEILGDLERVNKGDPFRKATIATELGRYLDEEKAAIESRRGEMDERETQWARMMRKARKRYKAASSSVFKAVRGLTGSNKLAASVSGIAQGAKSGDLGAVAKGAIGLPFAAADLGMKGASAGTTGKMKRDEKKRVQPMASKRTG